MHQCPHCRSIVQMENLAHAEKIVDKVFGTRYVRKWDTLLCPNCDKVSISAEEFVDENGEIYLANLRDNENWLYPNKIREYRALPEKVQPSFFAAEKLLPNNLDASAVTIAKTLLAICEDKNAIGKGLDEQLQDLINKRIIPVTFDKVLKRLRTIRPLDDYLTIKSITVDEALVLFSLCETILEYVYEAPAMLEELKERLQSLAL